MIYRFRLSCKIIRVILFDMLYFIIMVPKYFSFKFIIVFILIPFVCYTHLIIVFCIINSQFIIDALWIILLYERISFFKRLAF